LLFPELFVHIILPVLILCGLRSGPRYVLSKIYALANIFL
jgi:hypothetical protein